MATLNEKLADSLQKLRDASNGEPSILRTDELSRTHLERLLKNGYLAQVMPGWVMVVDPTGRAGDSTPFYANYWRFLTRYCEDRFGTDWVVDPHSSLRLYAGDMSVPPQVVVISSKGNNQTQPFLFKTSMFSSRGTVPPSENRDGLRAMPLGEALAAAAPAFFSVDKTAAIAALGSLRNASEVLGPLLRGGHSVIAGRLAAALRSLGRGKIADDIVSTMSSAGHRVTEADNPLKEVPHGLSFERRATPVAARIKAIWASMRDDVLSKFDQEPSRIEDVSAYLADLEERYVADAYHSLSIEGYRVTPELIEKIRKGWNPDSSEEDRSHADAIAAKGYADCFKAVKEAVEVVLDGGHAAGIIRDRHLVWYRTMFQPSVTAGILPADRLAGYRTWFIHLRGSRFVPVAHQSIDDAMEAFFDCFEAEEDPRVAAVLGHFVFTYIHPFGDGNGRLGRFIMNVALASGGYPWTVVPVDERGDYLRALDAASLDHDIKPFSALVADLVRREPPPPRRRAANEEPAYRAEIAAARPREMLP